ncbi:MAG: type II toxin-antitoxin system VapC family toxin [Acidobacteriia bacterium]|nr:type II toxin-antitoxin system VapC family toxin [Terriglobia bacterium]MYG01859.1 type II toxin-antitoxin system VapC family toxin [Terriglobia bacterium]MYK10614.1 type II toxin-antitoxin system VapC family toxin [Terriglobia bacterium]
MTLYAETSAVLAWLLDEERAGRAGLAWSQLVAADAVHSSDLTLVECDRTLRRAVATGRISADESLRLHAIVDRASAFWTLHGMDAEVVERSRRSFPCEPIRSLDALHLATALVVRNLAPDVQVLSFDDRIRDNATALGLDLVPATARQLPPSG